MRLVYENAKKILALYGIDPKSAKLTQSDLVLEQALSTTTTQYQFAVLSNNNGPSGTQFNTEVRLTQQDSFIVSQMGYFIGVPTSATDATIIWHTYPSPVIFTTTTALAAETLYNSKLAIMVNNDNVMPVYHMGKHRSVPQSQQATAAANQNGIAQDQVDMSSDGWNAIEPNILLIGSKNSIITLTLPAAVGSIVANSRVRLWFRGLLAQNSTSLT
jgi:hypothetical protein